MAAGVSVAVPPPVAGLAVGVDVGRLVSVGWGDPGVSVAVPLADGVGVAVPVPDGAVALAIGEGVQATTGSTLFTFGFRDGPVTTWVPLTPIGSFHRLEFAVVPPLPCPAPEVAGPTLLFTTPISVPFSW